MRKPTKPTLLGTFLRQRRYARRLSLAYVAYKAHTTAETLSELEQGRLVEPTPQLLLDVARVLRIKHEEIRKLQQLDAEG